MPTKASGAPAGHGGEILSLQPSVSVVIRAKNEARFIGETLAAIFDSPSLPPRQVIVVDSGSSDGTQAIVRSFPTTLIQIRPEEFTYGYALNLEDSIIRARYRDDRSRPSLLTPVPPRMMLEV